MHRRAFALVLLASACSYTFRPPPSPPSDARERQRAETVACRNGTFPYWMDDAAMKAAIDYDHRQATASAANDSFHGATFSAQPPPLPRLDPRTSALIDERTAFQRRCEDSKRPPP